MVVQKVYMYLENWLNNSCEVPTQREPLQNKLKLLKPILNYHLLSLRQLRLQTCFGCALWSEFQNIVR